MIEFQAIDKSYRVDGCDVPALHARRHDIAPRKSATITVEISSAQAVARLIAQFISRARWVRRANCRCNPWRSDPAEWARRSLSRRPRSITCASHAFRTPRRAPTPLSRKTGAIDSWMTCAMSSIEAGG